MEQLQKIEYGKMIFPMYCQKVIPLYFDESMSYYECLCALRSYINNLIKIIDNNAKAVEQLQKLYTELETYVNNYFTNLDVQEEINNKLDKMAEDGTLTSILLANSLKIHCIQKSAATFIIQFANGKNMFIDTGLAEQWAYIKLAIDSLNITKFDYGVITHFHRDHIGNIENFSSTYDLSNCELYIGMKPDFTNHADDILETESEYDNAVQNLKDLGLNPIVPENNLFLTIDNNTKLRFLNTSSELAEHYYGRQADYYDNNKINQNMFSLMTEIIHNDIKILSCGDIEKPTEEVYYNFVGFENLLIMPHHGVNESCFLPFYTATHPEYSLLNYVAQPNENWIGIRHKGFMAVKEQNSRLITYAWSQAPNNIITFSSNGKTLFTNVESSSLGTETTNASFITGRLYRNLVEVCDFSKFEQLPQNIMLDDILENMDVGSTLELIWQPEFSQNYPVLYSNIIAIFPDPLFYYSMILTIKRINDQHDYIKIHNENTTFECYRIGNTNPWRKNGFGITPELTENSLINYVNKLPVGNYICPYFKDSNNADMADASYTLEINVINFNNVVGAALKATLRSPATTATAAAKLLTGYLTNGNYGLNKVI